MTEHFLTYDPVKPNSRLLQKELSSLQKKFDLFKKGANEERKVLQKETADLKVQVERLEEAIRKNIKTTSEATSGVKDRARNFTNLNIIFLKPDLY